MPVRPAKPQDIEALAAFAARVFTENFGHLYDPRDLGAHLEKTCSARFFTEAMGQGDAILLAMDGETIVGYAKAGALGLPVANPPPNAAELHRLYIDAPHQGKALGHALLRAALNLPPLANATHIYLGVWENNHRAQAFYKSYGFTPVGEYLYYVGEHADREIIMVRVTPA